MLPGVDASAASLLGLFARLGNLLVVFVLCSFFALGLRYLGLIFLDPGRPFPVLAGRFLGALTFLGLGLVYGAFTLHTLAWDPLALVVAAALALALALSLVLRHRRRHEKHRKRVNVTGSLSQATLILALLLVATLSLMRAGFLALTGDRPVLLVDVTGETAVKDVAWAPPDQASRREALATHRVVFRTPAGEPVAEAWLYGDQVAVKGRVLRLSPVLNAAGIENLFELQFAHNGYFTADRHSTLPHQAVPLPCTGPLAVHPWWRPVQSRLLELWEKGTSDSSSLAVRSATTESTYFPLVDTSGQPIKKTFRVVLSSGGLSAS
jgi:hypothetical protein